MMRNDVGLNIRMHQQINCDVNECVTAFLEVVPVHPCQSGPIIMCSFTDVSRRQSTHWLALAAAALLYHALFTAMSTAQLGFCCLT